VGDTPPGVTHWDGPPLEAWDAWSPQEAAARLAGVDGWCVVGGWAVDLFLGERTRAHDDLEIEVPHGRFPAVRHALGGIEWRLVGDGEVRRVDGELPEEPHQTWALDVEAQAWRLDVMRVAGDDATWVCRRDPSITLPRAVAVRRTADGSPYLAPAPTLLFKAKASRPKDEADLAACLPRLAEDDRAWLRDALDRVHPSHPWLARLR